MVPIEKPKEFVSLYDLQELCDKAWNQLIREKSIKGLKELEWITYEEDGVSCFFSFKNGERISREGIGITNSISMDMNTKFKFTPMVDLKEIYANY